jgi:hypothetical protein
VANIQSMLVQLQARPDDTELRRQTAELLDAQGSLDDAVAVLAPLVNVTGHDSDAGLPCLCKSCLPSAAKQAASGDLAFVRSFAVADRRVLHFWMLAEQDRGAVRASVADSLRARLAYRKPQAPSKR